LLGSEEYLPEITEMEESFFHSLEHLRSLQIVEGEYFIHQQIQQGKTVLAEGAQGTMLDIDFGTYPFVTSSNTISAGVCTGLGVAPSKIRRVIGISKAYCTRVGSGPFPTELHDETGEQIRKAGHEFGSTTGRPRRCGWLDLVSLNYACMINGVTEIVITKADVLDDMQKISYCNKYRNNGVESESVPYRMEEHSLEPVYENIAGWQTDITACTDYTQIPEALKNYIQKINDITQIPVSFISNGPHRNQLLEI
jgi:adenylosuccinate synthase